MAARVLCAFDSPAAAQVAVPRALDLAAWKDAELTFLAVLRRERMEPTGAAAPRVVRRRAVGAGATAGDRARHQADAASSRRSHRRPAAGEVTGGPDDHGPGALRRLALGHALADAAVPCLRHESARRDRRASGSWRAGRSPRPADDLAARDLGRQSRSAWRRPAGAPARAHVRAPLDPTEVPGYRSRNVASTASTTCGSCG